MLVKVTSHVYMNEIIYKYFKLFDLSLFKYKVLLTNANLVGNDQKIIIGITGFGSGNGALRNFLMCPL